MSNAAAEHSVDSIKRLEGKTPALLSAQERAVVTHFIRHGRKLNVKVAIIDGNGHNEVSLKKLLGLSSLHIDQLLERSNGQIRLSEISSEIQPRFVFDPDIDCSGKTTFAKAIVDMHPIDRLNIKIEESELLSRKRQALARHFPYQVVTVTQDIKMLEKVTTPGCSPVEDVFAFTADQDRLKSNREYFENGCSCINTKKTLQLCPTKMPDDEAVAFYEKNCKCSRNYIRP